MAIVLRDDEVEEEVDEFDATPLLLADLKAKGAALAAAAIGQRRELAQVRIKIGREEIDR